MISNKGHLSNLAAGVGDLLAALRKKQTQSATKLAGEAQVEPAAKKAKICEKVPNALQLPAGSKLVESWSARSTTEIQDDTSALRTFVQFLGSPEKKRQTNC